MGHWANDPTNNLNRYIKNREGEKAKLKKECYQYHLSITNGQSSAQQYVCIHVSANS